MKTVVDSAASRLALRPLAAFVLAVLVLLAAAHPFRAAAANTAPSFTLKTDGTVVA